MPRGTIASIAEAESLGERALAVELTLPVRQLIMWLGSYFMWLLTLRKDMNTLYNLSVDIVPVSLVSGLFAKRLHLVWL